MVSPLIQQIVKNSPKAQKQLNEFIQSVQDADAEAKAEFENSCQKHLADAQITDARQISYNSAIKTEYLTEVSFEEILVVVQNVLNELMQSKSIAFPDTTQEAIDTYIAHVRLIIEAAKTGLPSDLTFSMNRLAPGLIIFLSATAESLQDTSTFGKETLCTTAIYCAVYESIQDLQAEGAFQLAIMDYYTLIITKYIQATLVCQIASEEIDVGTWVERDKTLSLTAQQAQTRLINCKFSTLSNYRTYAMPSTMVDMELLNSSIEKLLTMGNEYRLVVDKSKQRIVNKYFF